MGRVYNVVDSDGHILEPPPLWDDYIDPAFRDRAPKLVVDKDGKQRLLIEEQILGSRRGWAESAGGGRRRGGVRAGARATREGAPAASARLNLNTARDVAVFTRPLC